MGENIRLALILITTGKEVPDEILEAALEDLQLDIMEAEKPAVKYVMTKLYDAIKDKDKDAVLDCAKVAAVTMGIDPDDLKGRSARDEIEAMIIRAGRKFIAENGGDDGPCASILGKLLDEIDFMPIAFEGNLLVGMLAKDERLLVMTVNEGDVGGDEIERRFNELEIEDQFKLLCRYWDEVPEVMCACMNFKVDDDHLCELTIRSAR